jgi:predicted Fe-Mo cluster-binding NifX family protein
MAKILIPVLGEDIAPRFDLCTEAWIGRLERGGDKEQERILVLAHPSAEDMCQLAISENVDVVICNGIESQYFDYLQWKKIQVIDSVIAPVEQALKAFARQELFPGIILRS